MEYLNISSENKTTALIIGGSEGIGKATARLLAQRDIDLWLIARNVDRL